MTLEYFVKLECHFSWRAQCLGGAYFRGSVVTAHHLAIHHITQPHRITTASHPIPSHHITFITWHSMTWHHVISSRNQPHYLISPCNQPHHLTAHSHQHTTETKPANSWRLVRAQNLVWAAAWLVALRTFYRQILSLACSVGFSLWNFCPLLARVLLVLYKVFSLSLSFSLSLPLYVAQIVKYK